MIAQPKFVATFSTLLFVVVSETCHTATAANTPKQKLRALIIDGQNNHDWKTTTPLLRKALESSGRFTVDVATSPPAGHDMSGFRPKFSDYDVVVSNYNGDPWPAATKRDFERYVAGGGGFVAVHAADNAFPDWPEYNHMIGVGGWGGRNEKWGPHVYIDKQGDLVRDQSPGPGGHHGQQHEFQVRTRDPHDPIMRGLPPVWMHTKDELYDSLRGPAEDLHILATAYSAPNKGGTGHNEPVLMITEYGKGRVFHTTLGHADYSMNCVGFITTFRRGAEWAASGKVTIPVPRNFPTADKARSINE
ncbi:MAG TPA: ThuA domain-containing protein [Lacipirellulaceae bacterium]|nr:ThuA domain-containing protein [Lacipirellulaceae bacterium]